jgi:GT2 family glycosyltransferase
MREAHRARVAPVTAARQLMVVMVLAGPTPSATAATLRGLHRQVTDRWSLTMVVPDQELRALRRLVKASVPRRTRRRIHIVTCPAGTAERGLLRQGWSETRGSAGALIFPGDVWAPDTVALLVAGLEHSGAVYADEDRVTADGRHVDPRLKPDYSPDFLLSTAYVGRPLAVGSELTGDPAELVSPDGDIESEFSTSLCLRARTVTHIPEVLCHRTEVRPFRGEPPHSPVRVASRTIPERGTPARVSIVIPFRDQPRFLRTCLDSVRATTEEDLEFVLIDNASSEPETMSLLERVAAQPEVHVLPDAGPFNWARLSNSGARIARGDVLLFLNNDVEPLGPGWLSVLATHALREDVGAVGARLLYPDRRLQHCGIVVGLNGAAGHPLVGLAEGEPGYLGIATATRECSAVTGACLATRKAVFERLGGFDESLGVDLNDVDYCLRAGREGYRVVYAPEAELLHHESPSRGTAGATGDIVRFVERWGDYIAAGDRYYSHHLTRMDSSCGLAGPDENEQWNQWFSTLDSP